MSQRTLNIVAVAALLLAAPLLGYALYSNSQIQKEQNPLDTLASEKPPEDPVWTQPIAPPPPPQVDPEVTAWRQQRTAEQELYQDAKQAFEGFHDAPSAETAQALEDFVTEMRKPEHLHSALSIPLSKFYDIVEFPPGARRKLSYSEDEWKPALATVEKWQEFLPESTAAVIATAGAQIGYAFEGRGCYFSTHVSSWNQQLFEERLKLAEQTLDKIADSESLDAQYYCYRIIIEMGLRGDEEKLRELVKAGSQIAPEYSELYWNAAWFLLPRWHGKPGYAESYAAELHESLGGWAGDNAFLWMARCIQKYDPKTLYAGEFHVPTMRYAIASAMELPEVDSDVALFAERYVWHSQDVELAQAIVAQRKRRLAQYGNNPHNQDKIESLAASGKPDLGDHQIWLTDQTVPWKIDLSPTGDLVAVITEERGRAAYYLFNSATQRMVYAGPRSYDAWGFHAQFLSQDRLLQGVQQWDFDPAEKAKQEADPRYQREHFVQFQITSLHEERQQYFSDCAGESSRSAELVRFDRVKTSASLKVVVSSDEKTLIGTDTSTGKVFVWDMQTGQLKKEFQSDYKNEAASITADGSEFIKVFGGDARFYSIETGAQRKLKEGDPFLKYWGIRKILGYDYLGRLVFDSTRFTTEYSFVAYDLSSPAPTPVASFVDSQVSNLSKNGRYLAYLEEGPKIRQLCVVELQESNKTVKREVYTTGISRLAITDDGKLIACADQSGLIRLYKMN